MNDSEKLAQIKALLDIPSDAAPADDFGFVRPII